MQLIMTNSFFIAGSMYLAWILSPEVLVLVSNYAGQGGKTAPFALLIAFALSFGGRILSQEQLVTTAPSSGIHFITTPIDLAAQSSLLIFICTGMLVTAGFTFNETFLHWFPNFGFSALLLAIILIIHLLGDKAVETSQKCFAVLATLSLLVIIGAGILSHSELSETSLQITSPPPTSANTISLIAGGLLCYLGIFQPQSRQLSPRRSFYMFAFGALLLIFWQIISVKHVPQDTLTTSTIPYILVAREVLGETGRILIGLTIISGTCAAANYFMSMASRSGSALMVSLSSFPRGNHKVIQRLLSLFFAAVIAICMASGLAGELHLELYIYGALLLWLLSIGIHMLFGVLELQKTSMLKNILYYAVPAMFLFAFLYLTMTHNETVSLIIFITLALCFSSIFTAAVVFFGKKCNQQPSQKGD